MEIIKIHLLLLLAIAIIYPLATWNLYKKAGRKAWESAIPFYNIYVLLKIIHRPTWWLIILLIPIVGPILFLVLVVELTRHFGKKGIINGVLAVVLNFIFLGILNYSDAKYVGKEDRKETFISSLIFAVVFATIVHTFIVQPFTIPTSSMERTLLVGDFLFVDKISYGARIPTRPIAIPFLQNKIPVGNSAMPQNQPNSYVDAVKLPYMRLPSWRKVKKYDIVVFNYPADSLHTAIDRKDPYVKRLVGMPGDKIEIRDNSLFINDTPEEIKADELQQKSYKVITDGSNTLAVLQAFQEIQGYMPVASLQRIENGDGIILEGVTDENIEKVKNILGIVSVEKLPGMGMSSSFIFPSNKAVDGGWTSYNYGPITIPKKGDKIELTNDSFDLYKDIITKYEHNTLEVKNGKPYINGVEAYDYIIKQDYYWMMGDNRDASLDSRFWGFVPEDHIIGTPVITWFSLQGMFDVDRYINVPWKVRLDRMFTIPNNGVKDKTSYLYIVVALLIVYIGYDVFKGKGKKKKED